MNFHTIDPLILETLNLNERRMNHILDILHGKPKNKPKQINQVKKKDYFENSIRQNTRNYSTQLPDISRRNQTLQISKTKKINQKKYNTIMQSQAKIKRRAFSLRQNKNNYSTLEKNNQYFKSNLRNNKDLNVRKQRVNIIDESVTPISMRNYQKHQKSSNNSLSAVRSKFMTQKNTPLQSPSARDLSPRQNFNEDEVILEESLIGSVSIKNIESKPINKRFKTKQIINDYMGQIGLKKSKSMILNPKDIYRMEIQKLVGQLTPIEKLQDSQKKMKRIKKRHQNLKHFDQKYYSRLNEMDLVLL